MFYCDYKNVDTDLSNKNLKTILNTFGDLDHQNFKNVSYNC